MKHSARAAAAAAGRVARRDLTGSADEFAAHLNALRARTMKGPNGWGADAVAGLATAIERLRQGRDELIAARAQAEQDRERYRDLFQFAPYGYLVTDEHGKIVEANQAVTAMLGVAHASLMRQALSAYVAPEDQARFDEALRALRRRRKQRGRWAFRFIARGRDEPIVVDAAAVATLDGARRHLHGLRWTFRDVTADNRREAEIADQQHRLAAMTSELSRAEERERQRIATGIHDRISQPLAAIKMALGQVRRCMGPMSRKRSEAAMAELHTLLEHAIDESRTLTFELSPPILYQLGLVPAIQWLVEQLARRHGIAVAVADQTSPAAHEAMPLEYRVLMFQAVRELLNNVIKHARATQVTIKMSDLREHAGEHDGNLMPSAVRRGRRADAPGDVPPANANGNGNGNGNGAKRRNGPVPQAPRVNGFSIDVQDNGRGFKPEEMSRPDSPGFGLFNLRTRFAQIGGEFEINSNRAGREHGTRAVMTIRFGSDRDPAGTTTTDAATATTANHGPQFPLPPSPTEERIHAPTHPDRRRPSDRPAGS